MRSKKTTKADLKRRPSPSRPLAPSPHRGKGAVGDLSSRRRPWTSAPDAGAWVILHLREPREKAFGRLLKMDAAGVWVRAIELESFEAWAREHAAASPSSLGPSTFFVPFLRVEKLVEDERMGPVPSLRERFEAITGRPLDSFLRG